MKGELDTSIFSTTLSILEKLISFDTTSRHSNLDLIHYIQEYLSAFRIDSELLYNQEHTKASLIARIGPDIAGGFLLSGHTDVVPVDGQEWNSDPFVLTRKENAFFGRGTADMKSFCACMLAMAPEFARAKLVKPLTLAFSYDEEVGCLSAPQLAQSIQSRGIRPQLAIIGEPTHMQVVVAHKGICSFETVVTGHENHSSEPEKGVNAVAIGAELVNFLSKMAEEFRTTTLIDGQFEPPYTTVHVGVMKGGTARNIIPRECRILWEIRPLPHQNVKDILDRFEYFCSEVQIHMRRSHPGTSINTYPMSSVPGLKPFGDFPAENLLMYLTGSNETHSVSFATEAGIFQQHGIPSIVCGPGSIAQAHKPDEYIEITQIEGCIHFLQRLLAVASQSS